MDSNFRQKCTIYYLCSSIFLNSMCFNIFQYLKSQNSKIGSVSVSKDSARRVSDNFLKISIRNYHFFEILIRKVPAKYEFNREKSLVEKIQSSGHRKLEIDEIPGIDLEIELRSPRSGDPNNPRSTHR